MLPVWIVLVLLPILGGAERFNCRGRILGAYYADAKSGCKAFHVCVRVAGGGIRDFRFFCPPGTLFHQEAQTCTDWGDDDPLACPADLYDGQFDLYKIGSGYDTKKLSSPGNRDEEAEFGLQRAETGDRRSQNSGGSNGASDLRAAHSSDFFSGQRDRGRDEAAPPASSARPSSPPRQSFRRPTSPRTSPSSTPYTTPSSLSPQSSRAPQYDTPPKRKLIRKRPIYASTAAPTTFAENTPQESFSQQPQQFSKQPLQSFSKKQQQTYSQQPEQSFSKKPLQPYSQQQEPQFSKKPLQTFVQQSQQFSEQKTQQLQQSFSQQPQQTYNQHKRPTTSPPANVPPQYKDEYVEVSRVTPKQNRNRYYPNNPTQSTFTQSTPQPQFNKKDSLAELYNYDAQSTPGLIVQKDNRPFKVRNSFSVSDLPSEPDFIRINNGNFNSNSAKEAPTTVDYNTAGTRSFATSTPAYKNFNSVSYEPEKNNFVSFSGTKQNYFNGPSTTPTTTIYTTDRSNTPQNFNTAAYNTNIALNTIQPANYADNAEDDGQYRPPQGEDDGQYRPELYERELLSGAHSLNIAASGNRLPEDQKQHGKSQVHLKPTSQTSAPRPFRPAPTAAVALTQTTRAPEPTYTTTYRPPTTFNTQRTFDYIQTYTTTSRPSEAPVPVSTYNFAPVHIAPARPATTLAPRTPEPRTPSRAPAPPALSRVPAPTLAPASAPNPSTRAPHFSKPAGNKEDASYDYAYYDSDPGFSEYDRVEEFSKTKTRT